MKTIKFTIQERLSIPQLLNNIYQKGGMSLQMLTDAQSIARKLVIEVIWNEKAEPVSKDKSAIERFKLGLEGKVWARGNEEAKRIELREIYSFDQGNRISQFNWDAKKDKGKSIEFSSDEIKLLSDIIERKNTEKDFTITDGWILDLNRKLKEPTDIDK